MFAIKGCRPEDSAFFELVRSRLFQDKKGAISEEQSETFGVGVVKSTIKVPRTESQHAVQKSASRRPPPRLTFSYDISLKPVSGQRSFNAAVNKRPLFESCESSDVII